MTDEEIKTYVTGRIDALLDGMTDVASLPQAEPDGGTTLPFVKGGRLVAAPVDSLGGGADGGALTVEEIDAAIASA